MIRGRETQTAQRGPHRTHEAHNDHSIPDARKGLATHSCHDGSLGGVYVLGGGGWGEERGGKVCALTLSSFCCDRPQPSVDKGRMRLRNLLASFLGSEMTPRGDGKAAKTGPVAPTMGVVVLLLAVTADTTSA